MNSILVKQLTKLIICNFRTTYVTICELCFDEALLATHSQQKKETKLNTRCQGWRVV